MNLTGRYSLDGGQFDFQGKARLDAELSQMVTGWKSILLKPVDPFFAKDGAGAVLPVSITGTGSNLDFGIGPLQKDGMRRRQRCRGRTLARRIPNGQEWNIG